MNDIEFEKMVDCLLYLGIPLQRNIYSLRPSIYGKLLPVQTQILNTLYKKGVMRLNEIAKYLGKTSQSLTKPLQDLAAKKLVVKTNDEYNKKVVNFALTKAGRDMEAKAIKHINNNCRIKFSDLTDCELERLRISTDELITLLDKMNEHTF